MAEDIISKCSSLSLDDDDRDLVDLGKVENTYVEGRIELMLVGRLVTNRPYNVEAFRRTMEKVWSPANNMISRAIGPNLFAFQFFHWRDKEKVLRGRPWCWENNLLLLKEVEGEEQPEHISLVSSPFWIRVCNLPFNCRSTEDVKALTANIGNLLEVEEDLLGLGRYRRVRIEIDVRKPLRHHQWMKYKRGNKAKIEFKYERLPYFCFACGIIGHAEKDCTVVPEEERKKKLGWGTFLRASPRRGHIKEQSEESAITGLRRQLFVTKRKEEARSDEGGNQGEPDNQIDDGRELVCVGGEAEKVEENIAEVVTGDEGRKGINEGREDMLHVQKFIFRAEKQIMGLRAWKRVGKDLGEGAMELDERNEVPAPLLKKRMERGVQKRKLVQRKGSATKQHA